MNSGMTLILITLVAFAVTALLGFVMIPFLHKLKFGQTILDIGPAWHKKKQGTPTMGGVMFIIGITAAVVIGVSTLWLSPAAQGYLGDPRGNIKLFAGVAMALAFGAVGFLDDYIKVVKHRNLGLTARQKYLMQLVIGVFYLVMLYIAGDRSTAVAVPFLGTLELGPFYYLLAMIIITGFVNAVNLTDGLDGLSSSVTFVYAVVFLVIAGILQFGQASVIAAALAGGTLGFLVWNFYPAKVFMGDVGSLALGGMLAAISMALHQDWTLLLIGIIYVFETSSVMMQVTYFKLSGGKRIFRMTPVHHHFELGGFSGKGNPWSEWKVDFFFWGVGLLASLLTLAFLYLL